jgi:hypothetical protein
MVAPLCNNIGQIIFNILKNGIQVIPILTLCFFIIFLLINIFFLYITLIGANASPYLPRSYFGNWQGVIPFRSILITSLFVLFVEVTKIFREWIVIILISGKIVFSIYQEYLIFQLTFIVLNINILYQTIFATLILLDF